MNSIQKKREFLSDTRVIGSLLAMTVVLAISIAIDLQASPKSLKIGTPASVVQVRA